MQYGRFRIWPALIVFGVLLALVTVAPVAVGASGLDVSFGTSASGQKTIVVSGNGFAPGERVTITGFANDNSTVTFPVATANAIGAFDMTENFNPSVFRLKAVGQLTGITAFADVGPVAGTPPGFVPPYPHLGPCAIFDTGFFYNSCPGASGFLPGFSGFPYGFGFPYGPGYGLVPGVVPVPAPAPAAAPASSATVGTPVTITATGFTPNETVSAWATGPDGNVTQIGSAPASADGTVTITIAFPAAGNWQVTTHGQTSGKEVVNRYTVS